MLKTPGSHCSWRLRGGRVFGGLYYEKEGFGDPPAWGTSGDLSYIQAKYASDPNFLKKNGKPVILVYADANDGCGMADRWTQANAAVGGAFYVVLKVFGGYAKCTSQPDNWHQYAPGKCSSGLCWKIGNNYCRILQEGRCGSAGPS